MEFQQGDVFHNVYEIQHKLGRGGMGSVYLARHSHLLRDVALKIPHLNLLRNRDTRGRMEREARVMARLHHENIVSVYDMRWEDEIGFIALEYVAGVSLRDFMRQVSSLRATLGTVLGLAHQVARAVDYMHQEGVVHRDLKPSNILVQQESNRVKLLDFGLARSAGLGEGAEFRTLSGMVSGTPGYMAPEQMADPSNATTAADIYSFGVLVYKILTRGFPWEGESQQLLAAQISRPPTPVHEKNPRLPKRVSLVFSDCFRGPEHRPASTKQFFLAVLRELGSDLLQAPYSEVVPGDDEVGYSDAADLSKQNSLGGPRVPPSGHSDPSRPGVKSSDIWKI